MGSYRPIAIVRVLYKLAATVLLKRIQEKLDCLQPEEQARFRATYSCSDVVHTLRQVAEKAHDWGLNVWVASLDLEKAIDKVLHANVDDSLRNTCVDSSIISFLVNLYSNQLALFRSVHGRAVYFRLAAEFAKATLCHHFSVSTL